MSKSKTLEKSEIKKNPKLNAVAASDLFLLKGVGESLVEKLSRLGIFRILDLFFHLPRAYQDRTKIIFLADLFSGRYLGKEVLVEGEILHTEVLPGRRRALVCYLGDPHAKNKRGNLLALRFFYFNSSQEKQFLPGKIVRAFGQIRVGKNGLEIIHPEYKIYPFGEVPPLDVALTPLYSLTEGLTQIRIRSLIQQAFQWAEKNSAVLVEILDAELLLKAGVGREFLSIRDALNFVHFPPKNADVSKILLGRHDAQRRLIIEELLAHRLSMEKIRDLKEKIPAPALKKIGALEKALLNSLPFSLTQAQQKVCLEIQKDLEKPVAMHRLLQGDVGSGKTLVAMISALQAIEHGVQVAVMAPTEILAEQHYLNFLKFLLGMNGVYTELLSGSLSPKKKKEIQLKIASGAINIIIGTQALFQDGVSFKSLGLVIIDEQHRFGVEQRQALLDKSLEGAHQLVMTATPIPRTLAMTSYADLNISVIDELPSGRQPIKTVLVNQSRRGEVIEKIKGVVSQGRQVYWVCTLIEESEVLASQAAEEIYQQLNLVLSPLKIGLVHGRMKPAEKQLVMSDFKKGETQILVATTVIEVGVDVPNATLMIIENPERLGLAQLHQLRGRVGRGKEESFCVLLYQSPLSKIAAERLSSLREMSNGFDIAEKDLELRGAGEVLGTRQTGEIEFKIADLIRDRELLEPVKKMAQNLSGKYGRSPKVSDALIDRWLGSRLKFQQV
jgi:ATP-dependent DNA helicase RecG